MSGKLGKIDGHLFDQFIRDKCGKSRPEVRTGPRFGVDVAIVDLPGGMSMALTSDPLSLIPTLGLQESAWLSVQLMANDMATTGFAPMYGQFVLNLPATFSKHDFNIYWEHIHNYCAQIGVAITGGHTGFIAGQESTIAGGGTFITVVERGELLVSTQAAVGDSILVTKTSAMSSVAILAMSFPETVKKNLGTACYQAAVASFYQTSSLGDALAASGGGTHKDITAMHDVTEGGVLGAIYELASASGNGAVIFSENIPVGEPQRAICRLFDLDPRYVIGAGAMIIACKKGAEAAVISRLAEKGIDCTHVGHLTEKETGIKLVENGVSSDLTYDEDDPYWGAFFKAYKNGWK